MTLDNVPISKKLWLIVGVSFIGLLVVMITGLFVLKHELMAGREVKARNIVELGYSLLAHYDTLAQGGAMSVAEAKAAAKAAVKSLRYAEKEYLWINDMHPTMVMHPYRPELDGTDISGFTDPAGKHLFVEMVATVKAKGAGYVAYQWPKPGLDPRHPVPKLSYVKGFAPWGWIIGSGIYIDDVETAFLSQARIQGGIMAVVLALSLALSYLASAGITRGIRHLTQYMTALAGGDKETSVPDTQRDDEIGIMARSVAVFREGLLQNDRLAEANRHLQALDQMKSDFLSSVSHELRTPLTSIRGFTSLINRDFSRSFMSLIGEDAGLQKKSQRIRDNLEIILKESERLTRLVNDVLDLAKIKAGRIEWHDVPIPAETLVRDAANAVQGMFDAKPAVSLHLEIQPDLPLFIGDADRMLQVLVNLLNNAVKFTEQGTVTVMAALNEEKWIQLAIRDTGIGFPAVDADAIFDKFQQSRHGDTLGDRPKGTGLGLAISREIVTRHGGRIWAASEPGKGSVFTLTLPATVSDPQGGRTIVPRGSAPAGWQGTARNSTQPIPSIEGASAKGRPKVLVVDDDAGIRAYLTQLVQEQGYEVISAADGQAALVAARNHRPDLITMDLSMPVMDGRTAIVQLRADPELQQIPIMVISALPDWETAGGDLAMDKPLDESRFLANIRLLLNSETGAASRTACILILHEAGDTPVMMRGYFGAHCEVAFCPIEELPARIEAGFQGMVVIPTHLIARVDLNVLQATPALEIIIMPIQAAGA